MLDPAMSLVFTCGLSLLFAAAACHKLRDWARFRGSLEGYRVLPGALVPEFRQIPRTAPNGLDRRTVWQPVTSRGRSQGARRWRLGWRGSEC